MMNPALSFWVKIRDISRRSAARTRARLENLWLFGTLLKCTPKNFLGALYEFSHGFIFATMPFWLGGLVLTAQIPSPSAELNTIQFWIASFWSRTVSTFSQGELLVFAISLLSPTLWLAAHEPERAEKLPHRRPISTLAVLVIIVGAVLFAVIRASEDPKGLNLGVVFWISIVLTGAAFLIRYMALVYHSYRLPNVSESDLIRPQENWMRSVELHRRAET